MDTFLNDGASIFVQFLNHPIDKAQSSFVEEKPSVSLSREVPIEEITLCHLDSALKLERLPGF